MNAMIAMIGMIAYILFYMMLPLSTVAGVDRRLEVTVQGPGGRLEARWGACTARCSQGWMVCQPLKRGIITILDGVGPVHNRPSTN